VGVGDVKRRWVLGKLALAGLALALVVVPACSDSDSGDDDGGPPPGGTVELHYDGAPASSPQLTGNKTYEAAARFTSAQTALLEGDPLVEVRFYIQTVPDTCRVKVYGAGTPTTPGTLLYSSMNLSAVGSSWNTHVLTSPVTVPNSDLWISIEFSDTLTQPTIGCDPGPGVPDGDWLYDSGTGNWAPFTASINWNVRGLVETD